MSKLLKTVDEITRGKRVLSSTFDRLSICTSIEKNGKKLRKNAQALTKPRIDKEPSAVAF